MFSASGSDPLGISVTAGIAGGHGQRRMPAAIRARVRALRDFARVSGDRSTAIAELLTLVREYPRAEGLQKIVARLFHELHDDERAIEAWRGIAVRYPESMDAYRTLVALTNRHRGAAAAKEIIQLRFPRMPVAFDQLLAYAETSDLIGETSDAETAFARLAQLFEKRIGSWLTAASWLEARGQCVFVSKLLRRIAGWTVFGRPITKEPGHVDSVLGELSALGDLASRGTATQHRPPIIFPSAPRPSTVSIKVVGALFDLIIEERARASQPPPRSSAPIVMISGSLGCGGAERQLVNTAIGLSELATCQRTMHDGPRLGPVTIIARSLRSRADGEFLVPDLRRAGIAVSSYQDVADFGGNLRISAARPYLKTFKFIPWAMAEGVIKLTDLLRSLNPEVVHIWQDGMIYATGLAALLAGVPRIILSARSVPPPDRRQRYLAEYDIIFKSLLRAPGVKLSVNSHYSAARYSAWLGTDPDAIDVIPNGVVPCPTQPDRAAEEMSRAFDAQTRPYSFTLGTVMRIDDNKRPFLWVDAAARLLHTIPTARFIIVGDGPLRARVARHAEMHAVSHRLLFVGRSACVGYWLKKMDAFMLLSRHEGLPNALIEAQLARLPVITSPAGGAAEAVLPGTTGIVTSQSPSSAEVAALVAGLIAEPGRLNQMGAAAEKWASDTFPLSQMLSKTVKLYTAHRVDAVKEYESELAQ